MDVDYWWAESWKGFIASVVGNLRFACFNNIVSDAFSIIFSGTEDVKLRLHQTSSFLTVNKIHFPLFREFQF